jgi:hypothetical protein
MKRFGEADSVLGINKTSMRHLPGQSWRYTGAISGTKLARPTQKTAVCASSARNAKHVLHLHSHSHDTNVVHRLYDTDREARYSFVTYTFPGYTLGK